jgi:hypothetical protein
MTAFPEPRSESACESSLTGTWRPKISMIISNLAMNGLGQIESSAFFIEPLPKASARFFAAVAALQTSYPVAEALRQTKPIRSSHGIEASGRLVLRESGVPPHGEASMCEVSGFLPPSI